MLMAVSGQRARYVHLSPCNLLSPLSKISIFITRLILVTTPSITLLGACWESSVAQPNAPNALNLAQAPHAIVLGIVSGPGIHGQSGRFLTLRFGQDRRTKLDFPVLPSWRTAYSRSLCCLLTHIHTRPSRNGSSFVCLPTLDPACIRTAPVSDGVDLGHALPSPAQWLRVSISPYAKNHVYN